MRIFKRFLKNLIEELEKTKKAKKTKKTNLVGNDRDRYGCINSAGYTWCEKKKKCLRLWEENCV